MAAALQAFWNHPAGPKTSETYFLLFENGMINEFLFVACFSTCFPLTNEMPLYMCLKFLHFVQMLNIVNKFALLRAWLSGQFTSGHQPLSGVLSSPV